MNEIEMEMLKKLLGNEVESLLKVGEFVKPQSHNLDPIYSAVPDVAIPCICMIVEEYSKLHRLDATKIFEGMVQCNKDVTRDLGVYR